jgi:phage-related protein
MATFTYVADWGASERTVPRVLKANFGNGYEQRVADGLNWKPRVWDLTFTNRDDTESAAITSFLSACGGVSPFDWTPPIGAAGKFLCREWRLSVDNYNASAIQASFEEVFEQA